jgi:hypothetical protein
MGLRRARRELERELSYPLVALGWLGVPDPEVFNDVVSMMAGAAALGGMSAATGEPVDRTIRFLTSGTPRRPPGMPHHVLVVVGPEPATVYAVQRPHLSLPFQHRPGHHRQGRLAPGPQRQAGAEARCGPDRQDRTGLSRCRRSARPFESYTTTISECRCGSN